MHKEVIILLAEDDIGHAGLIQRNLSRAGVANPLRHFLDGQEILDFLLARKQQEPNEAYLLLLDIRMPKVDGLEVLRHIKADPKLRKLPVIMLTTTDDPSEVVRCHELGCNNYVTKPLDYECFVHAIRQLGLFLTIIQVPQLNGEV